MILFCFTKEYFELLSNGAKTNRFRINIKILQSVYNQRQISTKGKILLLKNTCTDTQNCGV